MVSNLVKKFTHWNSNSKVHNFVPVRHTFTTIFLTARTYLTLVFPQRVFFLPVFQSFQVSFSLKVILLYTTIRERVENEVIWG